MLKRVVLSAVAVAVSGVLVGCGGGGSNESTSITKIVTDDPVSGLNYKCSSDDEKKKTNSKGEFTCTKDDDVTFYIGSYEIATVSTSKGTIDTMRIADLGLDYDAATDIRQILQTIDEKNEDGLITIPDDFDDLKEMSKKPGESGFDDEATKKLGKELVSEEKANAQALLSGTKQILAGKTLYHIQGTKIDKVKFASDMKTFLEGEKLGNTHTISIVDSHYLVDGEYKVCIGEVSEKYIEIVIGGEKDKLFFNESDAKEFLSGAGETGSGETGGGETVKPGAGEPSGGEPSGGETGLKGTEWLVTETIIENSCGESIGEPYSYNITITDYSEGHITISTSVGEHTGTYTGSKILYKGSYREDDGTTTASTQLEVNDAKNRLEGDAEWTWTDGSMSCDGKSHIVASRK